MDTFDRLVKQIGKGTQRAFADRVGAQQSEVSLWARKLRVPAAKYWPALNRLLGTTFDDWMRVLRAKKAA